jgi:hypothetical protein
MFASNWGYYLARSYLRVDSGWVNAVLAVAAATTLHGIYDFLVLAEPLSAVPLSAVLMLLIWIWRIVLIRGIQSRNGHEPKCTVCEIIAGEQAPK